MNRGLAKLSDILPVGLLADMQAPRQVVSIKAPVPKTPMVIGDPTRTPVNRQSALLTAKSSWIYQPLPAEEPRKSELERLREENTTLRATNKNLAAENAGLLRRNERLLQKLDHPPAKQVVRKPTPPPCGSNPEKLKTLERLIQ